MRNLVVWRKGGRGREGEGERGRGRERGRERGGERGREGEMEREREQIMETERTCYSSIYFRHPSTSVATKRNSAFPCPSVVLTHLANPFYLPFTSLHFLAALSPPPNLVFPHAFPGTSGSTFQIISAYSWIHLSLLKKPILDTLVIHLLIHSSWFLYASSTSSCVLQ